MHHIYNTFLRSALLLCAITGCVSLQSLSAAAETASSLSGVFEAPIQIDVTPDLWAFSTTTKAVVNGNPVASRLPFSEAAKDLKSIFLGKVAVKKGPLVLLADINLASVGLSGNDVPSTVSRMDINSLWSTVGAGYAFENEFSINSDIFHFVIQPTVSALYTSQEVAIENAGGQTLADLNASWWTPAIGINAVISSGSWGVRVVGDTDISGHSRSAKQAALALEYSLQEIKFGHPTLGLGYRYRYDERTYSSSSQISTTLRGPMAYATIQL